MAKRITLYKGILTVTVCWSQVDPEKGSVSADRLNTPHGLMMFNVTRKEEENKEI